MGENIYLKSLFKIFIDLVKKYPEHTFYYASNNDK